MARFPDILTEQDFYLDGQKFVGPPIGGALVLVQDSVTGALASLTTDDGNTLNNPFFNNPDGTYVFNTADGIYDIIFRYGGRIVAEKLNNLIGTAAVLPPGSVANFLGTSTTVAPSQKAVNDGLALKASLSDLSASTGATLVRTSSGKTVEQEIALLKLDALSMAQVWKQGSDTVTMAANAVAATALCAVAVAQGKAIHIPVGKWYSAEFTSLTGCCAIICDGEVFTNTKGAFVTMQAVGGADAVDRNLGWTGVGPVTNLDGTQNQRECSMLKIISDGCKIERPFFSGIRAFGFYQVIDNSAGYYVTDFGNEGRINKGLIENCFCTYYGALNSKYFIRHRSGSGTAWIYRGFDDALAVGTSPAGSDPVGNEVRGYPALVRVESGATGVNAVVSDMLFDGQVSGLKAGCISIDGNCTYNSNLAVTPATQIDAQAIAAIMYDPDENTVPILNVSQGAFNIGGGLDPNIYLPRSAGSWLPTEGFGQSQGGIYNVSSLPFPGAQTIPFISVQMQQNFGCEVELWANGDTFGVTGDTGGLRKRVYALRHDGTNVSATNVPGLAIDNPSPLSSNFFDFAVTIDNNTGTVTISIIYSATGGGSKLQAQYRVTAGAWKVLRLAA